MNDELTQTDIEKMKAELYEREAVLMPKLIEEVKRTRAFGDLSENYEYKAAKQDHNKNKSRIRYLKNMIKTATIIEDQSTSEEIGLYDEVEIYNLQNEKTQKIQVVTTVRTNPMKGLISRESPLGKAILGKKVGDEIPVHIDDQRSYTVRIMSIVKKQDDGSAPLMRY